MSKTPRSDDGARPAKKAKVAPAGAADASEAPAAPVLRRKDMVDMIVSATGAKRKDVRQIVELTLGTIGDALARGDSLILPPLGHLSVHRRGPAEGPARMLLRLRRGTGQDEASAEDEKESPEALAEPKK
ncbi:HU family DNA-binding protein [Rhodobacter sp. NSM]|uniref:HU family DNA-binding protein n=1 Tax=Rhodobacter sp. NSM TaxID=3457501 RepID=UPI003FD05D07